jgi:hypothetical protein
MNVNSRLEDAVPFDREILREHIALRMLCNAVNEGYPNLTPINHYECTYEFERYFANAKLRLFDKTKEPDKVEFEDPVGNPIMPPDVFIMEKLKIPIDYFKERVESRSASAKRSRTNDYTRSDVSGSDLIKMGGSAQSSSMIFSQQSSLPSEFRSNFGPGHSSRRQQFDPNIDPRLQPQETGNTQPPSPGLDGGESEFPFEDFLHLNPPLPKPGFGEQKSTARQSSPPNQWQDILDKSRTTTPDGQSRAKNPGMGSDNLAR